MPEDIQFLVPSILNHRIVLSMEGALHMTKYEIMQRILKEVDVPVEVEQA